VHSPDRRYWWDGSEWRLAVSRDGQLWFDGTSWVPNPLKPPGLPRLPTRWTRPLQAAVVAVTLLGFGSFVATLPLVASMPTPTLVLVPEGTSPEDAARFAQTMRPVMVASLIFQAVLFGVVAALIVIGSIRRWRWMFWAVLVLLGLNVVGLLIPLLLGVAGLMPVTPPPGVIPTRPPPVPMVVGVAGTLAEAAAAVLFVAMVVAGVRIGSWACRRAAEVAPATGPPSDA
jgi:hypothetical protein